MKNSILETLTQQGVILGGRCPICDKPMFFSWENRKKLVCNNCGTLYKLIFVPSRRNFTLAIKVDLLNNSGVVKCVKCGNAFEPDETESVFHCPACNTSYFNLRGGLIRNIRSRLNLVEDGQFVVKKVRK